MLEIDDVSSYAKTFAEKYGAFPLSLMGLYGKALDGYTPLSVRTQSAFREQASSEAIKTSASLSKYLFEQSNAVALQAITDTIDDIIDSAEREFILDAVKDATATVAAAAAHQLTKDVATVRKMYQQINIRTKMISAQNGWAEGASFIAAREGQNAKFRFMDRAGRRWDSERFMTTLARGHFLNIYNDVALYALSNVGQRTAKFRSANEAVDGYRFSITGHHGGENLESYQDLIDKGVIHPNCSLLVSRE